MDEQDYEEMVERLYNEVQGLHLLIAQWMSVTGDLREENRKLRQQLNKIWSEEKDRLVS